VNWFCLTKFFELMNSTGKLKALITGPRNLLLGLAIVMAVLMAAAWLRPSKTQASNSFFTVKKGDFLISVVEGGTLQAVNEVIIRNEVEGTARVIFIVPEGSYVKKGGLLVELDSASAQDQVNQQLIAVEKAQFALIQAEEQLEIQKSIVESEIRAGDLKLRFAQMDLEKFNKGEALQETTKAKNDITTLQEKLAIDSERANWSIKLAEQGFETKSKRDQDELTKMQTTLSLQMATNALWMLEKFDLPKKRETYESAVKEAEKELERIKHQGTRKLAQYEADVKTQKITLDLSKNKLDRDQRNLAAGKIYAPQDGLVVYSVSDNRFSSESLIEEGATVRNRQTLIKLPDVSEMKLSVKIHESHINLITPGQPAFIVLDSMPDQRFRGHVSKVGLLPDTSARWGNPNLKVYATEILVTDKLTDIKPGVSARAEIIVTNLHNVISVPLQAVASRQGRPVVYKADGTETKPVNVQVGLYNNKFIEVTSGLGDGDRILLSPPFDMQQKDLGGSVLAEGEEVPFTNLVAAVGRPPDDNNANNSLPPKSSDAAQGAPTEARPERGQGSRMSSQAQRDFRKQFDKDGDGDLNDEERQAMRVALQARFGSGPAGESSEGDAFQRGGERRRGEPRGDSGGESRPASGGGGGGGRDRSRNRSSD
jgi:HlyD family secretion protein